MATTTDERPIFAPTGELHRDPITPWEAEAWARLLNIPEQQVRQLAAEVGPVYRDIEAKWIERVKNHVTTDEIRKAQRDGRLVEPDDAGH